ncbi:hypothetical protein PtA15_8A137 [Puccinia triticina]|uniref:Uncharacterized protein n=1 Tax=Puccinia triticina TaxID=208348 RepID=A0ABY7CQC2_9BASI|nr:uncharacterized protein PtA15_8A137 [Puccinia triticina]WAQ87235.1 hypothetical protein PtA15_8A137 [Puccinia triticina]WAR57086.1 hypothetical protein PtB15_8B131 [Puccinia triticina]
MSPTDGASREQPGNGGNGALPPGRDQGWISSLVDRLVPKFQAQGHAPGIDSAMQTNTQGKLVDPLGLSK